MLPTRKMAMPGITPIFWFVVVLAPLSESPLGNMGWAAASMIKTTRLLTMENRPHDIQAISSFHSPR